MPTLNKVPAHNVTPTFQADDVRAGQLLRLLVNHWEGAYGAMLTSHGTIKGGWVEWHLSATRQAQALSKLGHITPSFHHRPKLAARLVGQPEEKATFRQTLDILKVKTFRTEAQDRQERSQQWKAKVAQAVQDGSGWAHQLTKNKNVGSLGLFCRHRLL
jgi:hypothetical protein